MLRRPQLTLALGGHEAGVALEETKVTNSASITVQNPEGRTICAPCAKCNRETSHDVITAVGLSDESPDGDIKVWEDYLAIKCRGCKNICFCHQLSCSEDYHHDPRTGERALDIKQTVYPSCLAHRAELEHSWMLPLNVKQIYTETHSALCEHKPVLAGIGIRMIIEAVCQEQAASGTNLQERIDSLISMGLITSDGAGILHCIRYMGNTAAHKVIAHTDEELSAAFDVVEYVLKGVYILPHIADKLPKK